MNSDEKRGSNTQEVLDADPCQSNSFEKHLNNLVVRNANESMWAVVLAVVNDQWLMTYSKWFRHLSFVCSFKTLKTFHRQNKSVPAG